MYLLFSVAVIKYQSNVLKSLFGLLFQNDTVHHGLGERQAWQQTAGKIAGTGS